MTVRDIAIYYQGECIGMAERGDHEDNTLTFEIGIDDLTGEILAYRCRRFGWYYGSGKATYTDGVLKIKIEHQTFIK